MQIFKAFALVAAIFFTCSTALNFCIKFGAVINGVPYEISEALGAFMLDIIAIIVGTGISVLLWHSVKNSMPRPSEKKLHPLIPEVPEPRSQNESKL